MSSLVFLLAACGGPPSDDGGPRGDDDDDDTVTSPEETASTGETGALTSETGLPGETGVRGVVIGPDGEPLADRQVLCCNSATCYTSETSADGAFWFSLDSGGSMNVAMKTHEDLYVSPRMGAALEPIVVTEGTVDVGAMWVPDLPAGVRVGAATEDPQTLAVGDGLELTLNRADLVPDFGVFLYDIAARRLPAEHVPPYAELGDEAVYAVYAVHPFATTSTSPIGVRLPCDLDPGTVVNVRSVDHIDGRLSTPATGRCDGSFLTTDPGQGVTKLTHLVISVP